jgi:carboxyl-terminal processing protease
MFMNAYATAIEPHTNYLGPRSAENFDIAMRLSLEGIGAVLQSRDDYTVIREIVPAARPPVRQAEGGRPHRRRGPGRFGPNFTDVLGWRIDDVVQLVRGEKDSVVRLDMLPADAGQDGKHTTVTIAGAQEDQHGRAGRQEVDHRRSRTAASSAASA